MVRKALMLLTTLALGTSVAQIPASATDSAASTGSGFNMMHEVNNPSPGGNALDFFERRSADGTVKRYAVAAVYTYGFDIIDVTTSDAPQTVSRYVSPGGNYHPWVQVNPRRNIVALSIEDPGVSPAHGGSNGVEFVDITDLTKPVLLGVAKTQGGARLGSASGLQGPHTIRMIGNNHIYTTVPTFIIDYTDPTNPVSTQTSIPQLGGVLCGHEFFEDPNNPNRTYVGFCQTPGRWGILDTSNPASPQLITDVRDQDIQYAHEVLPSPDSSFVAVTDFRDGGAGGQSYTRCPGGGVHFYDISGKYKPGASLTNPIKMGTYFAPYTGVAETAPIPPTTNPNSGPCNDHSINFQQERSIVTLGMYTGGTWVFDPNGPTVPGGTYTEYTQNPGRGLGPTTWGNTRADWHNPGDYVNAAQWYPFDAPAADRTILVNGMVRGLDVLEYGGSLPKKLSRLSIDGSAAGGTVTGVLDRYAVLTSTGWVNKPLAGQTIEVRSGGSSVTVVTGTDGSFSAGLGLASGSHQVTVTWGGNEEYEANSLSRQVQA